MTDSKEKTTNRGRPKKYEGAIPAAKRQAAYRKKMLEDGVEISIFLKHNQIKILRDQAVYENKTQSEVVGELLERLIKKDEN